MDPESREARKRLIRSDRATRKRPIQKPGFPWPPNAPRRPPGSPFQAFWTIGRQTPQEAPGSPREAPGAQGAPGGSRDPQAGAQGSPRRPQEPQSAQSLQKACVLRCFGRAPSPRSHEMTTFHTTVQISMRFAMNSRTFPTTPQRNAHFRSHFDPKWTPF